MTENEKKVKDEEIKLTPDEMQNLTMACVMPIRVYSPTFGGGAKWDRLISEDLVEIEDVGDEQETVLRISGTQKGYKWLADHTLKRLIKGAILRCEDAEVEIAAKEVLARLASAGYSLLGPAKWAVGQRVTKRKGASWTGQIVGLYSTELTPVGYAVESENEPGSVQIYPEDALVSK